jgi:hypothetical protein
MILRRIIANRQWLNLAASNQRLLPTIHINRLYSSSGDEATMLSEFGDKYLGHRKVSLYYLTYLSNSILGIIY